MKYGSYDIVKQEKQLMLMTTNTEKMVIHFSHKDFKKCAVMDKHLEVVFLFMLYQLIHHSFDLLDISAKAPSNSVR